MEALGTDGQPSVGATGLGPRVPRSVCPFGAAALISAGASLLGSGVFAALGLLLMAATAPIAPELGRRLLLGFVWFAGLAGLGSLVPGYPPGPAGLLPMIAATAAFVLLLAGRDGWPDGVPRVHAAEVVVCVGSGLVLIALAAPVIGKGTPTLLRDVATGWDNLPHFQSIALLIADGARVPQYNYGYHLVGSLLAGESPAPSPAGPVLSLLEYESLRFGLAWLCSMVLGLLAIEGVRALRPDQPALARSATSVTAVAFVVSAPLAGFIGAYSLLGFGNFLWAVTAVATASWLALDPRSSGARAGLLLALGIVAAFSGYRSVQVGMAAAAGLVVKRALDRRAFSTSRVRWVISLTVGGVVFSGWVPLHYYETSATTTLAVAQVGGGGAPLAIPAITILVELALLLGFGLSLIKRVPEAQKPLIRILAPIPGFLLFAVVLGVEFRTTNPLDSYYVLKSASAIAVIAFPMILAVATAAFLPTSTHGSATARLVRLSTPVLFVAVLLALLPNAGGRSLGIPAGVHLLDRRMQNLQSGGASDFGIVEAAHSLGAAEAAVLVLPAEEWRRRPPVAASAWLDALRGTFTSPEGLEAAMCAQYVAWAALRECLVSWARNHQGDPLVIVDLDQRIPAGPELPTNLTVLKDLKMGGGLR